MQNSLFGHVLRLDDHTPAHRALSQVAAIQTVSCPPGWRRWTGRPRNSCLQQITDGTPFGIRAEWTSAHRRGHIGTGLTQWTCDLMIVTKHTQVYFTYPRVNCVRSVQPWYKYNRLLGRIHLQNNLLSLLRVQWNVTKKILKVLVGANRMHMTRTTGKESQEGNRLPRFTWIVTQVHLDSDPGSPG